MQLTPHEEKILKLVRKYPQIVDDHAERSRVAEEHGYTEKTLRNRIGDLKKYGVIEGESSTENHGAEMTLFEIFSIIWSARWKIIRNVAIVSIISVIVALIMPLTFRSTAVIMPPSSEGNLGLAGALSSLPFSGLIQGGGDSKAMKFLAILKSRKVNEEVVRKFDLLNYYEVDYMQEALEELDNNNHFEIDYLMIFIC